MTLEQLNAHLELVEKYITARSMAQRLRDSIGVKAQTLSGMPHGSGVGDTVGNIVIEIVRAEEKAAELAAKVAESQQPIECWIETISDVYTQTILRLRYIHGMAWKEIAASVGGGNSEQSVKVMCYRLFET